MPVRVDSDLTRDPVSIVFMGYNDMGESTICRDVLNHNATVDSGPVEQPSEEVNTQERASGYVTSVQNSLKKQQLKRIRLKPTELIYRPPQGYTILDKSLTPGVIAGVSQADVAVLVVSAIKGEFEYGFERGGKLSGKVADPEAM